MLGLKRGSVELTAHQDIWEEDAAKTILLLKSILNDAAVDIQHVGSTAIKDICAKPIIDIAVGFCSLSSIKPYIGLLEEKGIIFRKEDVERQLLFVIGDFEKDIRTHHIHFAEWDSVEWNNYINFRDYLNAFPEYAKEYETLKKNLATEFFNDRGSYTAGKEEFIKKILEQACLWRTANGGNYGIL